MLTLSAHDYFDAISPPLSPARRIEMPAAAMSDLRGAQAQPIHRCMPSAKAASPTMAHMRFFIPPLSDALRAICRHYYAYEATVVCRHTFSTCPSSVFRHARVVNAQRCFLCHIMRRISFLMMSLLLLSSLIFLFAATCADFITLPSRRTRTSESRCHFQLGGAMKRAKVR